MSSIFIKTMHENHLDEVVRIDRASNANPWSGTTFLNEIHSPTHVLLVAETDEGGICGFVGGQLVGDELHIHSLAVDLQFRRRSIGRALVQDLMQQAIERDVTSATLEVRVSNNAAISLYESLGFISEGIRAKYYADNGEDASIMWIRNMVAQ